MADVETKKLYARKSSGLVRTIGMFGAMVFGVHCISLSSSGFIPFSWVASAWPGASIIGVLTIAMFLSLFHAFTYASIGSAMPRSGADYTLASRTLSPQFAFASSFTLVVFSAMVSGSLIAWIPSGIIPTLFQSMGIIFNNEGFKEFAKWSGTPTGIIIIGTICLVIVYLLMILPTRTIVNILEIGFILGIIAWIIIYISLGSAKGPGTFKAAWDKFMGAGNYDSVIPAAEAAGMKWDTRAGTMTLAGLIMGFWVFYGYYIPTFFAGEVKQASKNLLAGSWSSLIVTWAVFVGGAILLQRLTPLKWIAAEGYLANNTDRFAMPWITFYAAILKPNIILVALVALGWLYTMINLAQTYFFYSSRIMFAWAFDRLIPEKISNVNPRLHSPIIAISIIAVISEIGIIDAATGGIMGAQLNFVFFAVFTQIVPVLAMTLFPFLKPDLYDQSPDIVRMKLGKIPVVTIIGAITLAYLLWMILASFLFPAVGGRIGIGTLGTLFGMYIVGFVIYYSTRAYRLKKEGIDISWTFKTIPPV